MPDPTPEERLRLLDPAQDPPRHGPGLLHEAQGWRLRADAARAVLQEAVEVLALVVDEFVNSFPEREVSPELALLLATEWRKRVNGGGGLTPEDYLAAMVATGLRVRGASGG